MPKAGGAAVDGKGETLRDPVCVVDVDMFTSEVLSPDEIVTFFIMETLLWMASDTLESCVTCASFFTSVRFTVAENIRKDKWTRTSLLLMVTGINTRSSFLDL